ncbi:hypothetical protein GCM10010468_79600 [Actinocorallia longicatena]|uniref:YknX-like C-terminal permuted SH3-like domain-containing protein n=1 Tax=Actinocorallia longicatena TaxID=111803 RepID=A0ABP6QM94_9ACTN
MLALLLFSAFLSGCSGGGGGGKVRLGPVQRGSVAEVVEAPATLSARANATLRSPAEGTIKTLRLRDGDTVKDGQVVATISSPTAREQLEQARDADRQAARNTGGVPAGISLGSFRAKSDKLAKAGFKKAREVAAQIPDKKDRAKVLAEITKAEGQYTSAADAATVAVGRLNAGLGSITSAMASIGAASRVQTRAAVKSAQRTVDALVLRAPFDGVVSLGGPAGGSAAGSVPPQLQSLVGNGVSLPGAANEAAQIAVGAPVTAGGAVVTVTDVSRLRLSADIDESDILKIKRGAGADADFDALPDATYRAEVYSVGVTPGQATGGGVTYKVQLTLKEGVFADGSAAPTPKPGMSAVVRIKVREVTGVLTVPTTAIVTSGQNSTVWVVAGGKAERRTIVTGAEGETSVEVRSGLKDGDRVVVTNADAVKQGQDLT